MTPKRFLKLFLPPIVLQIYHAIRRAVAPGAWQLVYTPHGWDTKLPAASASGYEFAGAIALERDGWAPFIRTIRSSYLRLVTDRGSNPDIWRMACDHNVFMTFGYVLALAAQGKDKLKILDYGGSLGPYYFISRALVPEVALEYHCKELPEMARAGQEFTPEVTWHTDDSCLEQRYDLVMFSASLQYIRDWQQVLQKASLASREYVYLTMVSVVERTPSFVVVQRHAGAQMLNQQLNKAELLSAIDRMGLRLIREFWVQDHPYVVNAPEQPSYYGCLLKRQA
jgi:putative methyltransferase (TIGR04325 family)